MFDVYKIREDFPMLKQKMQDKPLVYLDSGATSLKPQCVVDAIISYYTEYTASAHRGDYDISLRVDEAYEEARRVMQRFINAKSENEIVFTSGVTQSLNMVAFGYARDILKEGDEILISIAEHASNTLPWFEVARETKAVVKYVELNADGMIEMEAIKKAITPRTRIIALAHVTNVLGFEVPIKDICAYAHQFGITVVVDAAQSVPHMKTDVIDLDCDFLGFSAHKMCGPTGTGVLYGKMAYLEQLKPTIYGGGSNAQFNTCGEFTLKDIPTRFESGTPNIEGVIGMAAAANYLMDIGMEDITKHETELRAYALEKLAELDNVEVYNKNCAHGPVIFNVKGVFSQDIATHLNSFGIAVRAGMHCAKLLPDFLKTSTTVRASTYLYTTKEDIDKLIEALRTGDDFLNVYFE